MFLYQNRSAIFFSGRISGFENNREALSVFRKLNSSSVFFCSLNQEGMDEETEMFIFITPKIILDNEGESDRLRLEELAKRPGDIPEFLQRVEEAKNAEKGELFADSLKLLFNE